MASLPQRLATTWARRPAFPDATRLAPWLPPIVFLLSLLAFHRIFGSYLPTADGRVGQDYARWLPALLDGLLWFQNQGWSALPWFTPSFCGGQAFFANPHSIYLSLPQFLSFVTDPLRAVYLAHLFAVSLGFWGMYLLARQSFGMSRAGALSAAIVFMFNGFVSHRLLVGHPEFHGFMLVPSIALLLVTARACVPWRRADLGRALLAGLLLAYWLHSGMFPILVPAVLAILGVVALLDLRQTGTLAVAARRLALAVPIALALSAARLVAAAALIRQLPEHDYLMPGFDRVSDLFQVVFAALFYSSQHAYETALPLWRNLQWSVQPHELAFGVTLIPLAMLLFAGGAWVAVRVREYRRNNPTLKIQPFMVLLILMMGISWASSGHTSAFRSSTVVLAVLFVGLSVLMLIRASDSELNYRSVPLPPVLLLALTVLLPLLLLYYDPDWNALLQLFPPLAGETSPQRWLIMLLPPIAIWTGQAVDYPRFRNALALLCILGIPLLNALENRAFYLAQASFDPAPVIAFHAAVRQGTRVPAIETIVSINSGNRDAPPGMDALVAGESLLQCQNPLYGYRLEWFRAGMLREGPILDEVSPGYLNLRNPACMLYPQENGCRPGDTFRVEQRAQAEDFAHYRAYSFQVSWMQRVANALSVTMLLGSGIWGLGLLVLVIHGRIGRVRR